MEDKRTREKIGKQIAHFRVEKGLTQFELAERTEMSNNTISKIERGNTMPKCETLIKLCSVLEISVNEILFPLESIKSEKIVVEVKNGNEAKKKLLRSLIDFMNQMEWD